MAYAPYILPMFPQVEDFYGHHYPPAHHGYLSHQDQHHSHNDCPSCYSDSPPPRHESESDQSSIYSPLTTVSSVPNAPFYYNGLPPPAFDLDEKTRSFDIKLTPLSKRDGVNKRQKQRSAANERVHCEHPDCLDKDGLPTKFFSRKADVARHDRSQHNIVYIDCPKPRCGRKNNAGFTRNDHLVEHLRGYHQELIPKKNNISASTSGASASPSSQDGPYAPTD